MKDVALIYPHQLFARHPALRPGRHAALIEDPLFFGDSKRGPRFHKHKIVLHRASMKAYARRLSTRGVKVGYLEHTPGRSSEDMLQDLAEKGYERFCFAAPCDHRLMESIEEAAGRFDIETRDVASPLFLSPPAFLADFFRKEKKHLMARFYQAQRKRMGILVEGGKPRGGQWSFDKENRRKLPSGQKVPAKPAVARTKEVVEAIVYANERFPDNPGKAETFWYPTTHRQASRWLTDFLETRLSRFGDFEDAISARHDVLFHSVLSPVLNIGLIEPRAVVDEALKFSGEHDVPLNSLEGFIRQVIGWREYIKAMYDLVGEKQRGGNFWKHDGNLPTSFYGAATGMEPVDTVLRRVMDRSYCHHIERLMVLGNFMLLCGIHPHEVYRWFMEMFIDAYDWVMVPNVFGMSQFADGGIFTTKPYISGSNYIRKMSDFTTGPWCEIWDGLFWSFIFRHRKFFGRQPRLAIMTRQLERMKKGTLAKHRERAADFLSTL